MKNKNKEIFHINSENEKISIHHINNGSQFDGQRLLQLYDDDVGIKPPIVAMHLLDIGTIDWLIDNLTKIKKEIKNAN